MVKSTLLVCWRVRFVKSNVGVEVGDCKISRPGMDIYICRFASEKGIVNVGFG